MSRVEVVGWAWPQAAALAEALAGFGFDTRASEAAALAVIAPAAAALDPARRGAALILLGPGEAEAAAGGEPHRLPLPLRLGALVALLRRLEARRALDMPGEIVGPYRFHAADRLLLHGRTGEIARLTDKESALLAALAAAKGAPLSRERLLEDVWGYGARVATHTLETHIYRLRQKLGGDEAAASLLQQSEEGYRLVK